MEFLDRYPKLAEQLELLCKTRRDEILAHMIETDKEYEQLRAKRADASMALKNAFYSTDELFEEYSDAVYAQEVYELDAVYRQALYDALNALKEQGLL